MGSKTTNKTSTNQTSTAAPPSWALPIDQALAGQIMSGVNAVQAVPHYTGDFIAQPGALQSAVPGGYLDAAALARSLVAPAQQALQQSMVAPSFDVGGNTLNAALQSYGSTNPGGMDAAVRAAINPVYQNLTQNILPSLQSAGIESGAYGGSRALTTMPEMALRDFDTQAGNIAAQMSYQDYVDAANRAITGYGAATSRGLGEADTLTQRLGLTPNLLDAIMRMSGGSAELQAQGAAADTANRQATIDNALQKYQYAVQQPFMGYDVATDLISRLSGSYGTTTQQGTSTQTQSTGGLAPIIGGALGLAAMAGGFPTAGGGSVGGSLVSQLFGGH